MINSLITINDKSYQVPATSRLDATDLAVLDDRACGKSAISVHDLQEAVQGRRFTEDASYSHNFSATRAERARSTEKQCREAITMIRQTFTQQAR
jgi:hypothetical protein